MKAEKHVIAKADQVLMTSKRGLNSNIPEVVDLNVWLRCGHQLLVR